MRRSSKAPVSRSEPEAGLSISWKGRLLVLTRVVRVGQALAEHLEEQFGASLG